MGRTRDRPATRGATIADVAQRAGVGVSTVSRVLNDGQVSAPARERVLSAMSDLGYRPRASARALASGSTQTLGMVIPFFTHPSAVERVRGVLAAVDEAPFDLVVCNVSDPAQRDEYLGRMAPLDRSDGMLIVSLSPTDDEADAFLAAGAPVVLVDAHHPRLPSIVVDDVRGGRLATEHLIELGHERIAFVGDTADRGFGFVASERRRPGYRQGAAGLSRGARGGGAPAPRRAAALRAARPPRRAPADARARLSARAADGDLRRVRHAGARRARSGSRRGVRRTRRPVAGGLRRPRGGAVRWPHHGRPAAVRERPPWPRAAAGDRRRRG